MAKRSVEPLLWMVFSAGGVMAALFIPILLILFGLAFPLGLIAAPGQAQLLALLAHPVTRLVLFVVCLTSLFHAAHRLRYTLYDGLQIKHLNELISLLCYGGAIVGSVVAGYVLWRL
ncbi:MAG TPA: fumarate reductase subunit FrdD [Haliangiales bacterium]|nr:fumarate reductase subunit FrdD [Haliangiales bacterium]